MGKDIAEPVIDLDFIGLITPQAVFEMGRPDLKEGRPGSILIDAAREAKKNGVFAALQADRDFENEHGRKADTFVAKRDLDAKSLPAHLVDGPSKEFNSENAD